MKLFLILFASLSLHAGDSVKMNFQKGDRAPLSLINSKTIESTPAGEQAQVSLNWKLDPATEINLKNQGMSTLSKYYRQTIEPESLFSGIPLTISAKEAVVHLQILAPKGESISRDDANAIQLDRLILVDSKESLHEGAAVLEALRPDQKERAWSASNSAFRLSSSLGTGSFTLHLDEYGATFPIQVTVFEKQSPFELEVATTLTNFYAGETFQADLTFKGNEKQDFVHTAQAYLVSPDGRQRIAMRVAGNQVMGSLPRLASIQPGLWELHFDGSFEIAGQKVQRSARLAFGLTVPTGRFEPMVNYHFNKEGQLALDFGIEIGVPGRYEVKGLLYAMNAEKKSVPIAVFNSAAFFKQSGRMELLIDKETLQLADFQGPYQVKGLTLKDQSRMQVLSHLTDAFSVN